MCETECGAKAIFITFNHESNSITKLCPHCYYAGQAKYAHTVYETPTREIKITR